MAFDRRGRKKGEMGPNAKRFVDLMVGLYWSRIRVGRCGDGFRRLKKRDKTENSRHGKISILSVSLSLALRSSVLILIFCKSLHSFLSEG